MQRKERLVWIEIAQIISMLIIVFHHSIPKGYQVNDIFLLFANTLQYPALAVFFLASGVFSVNSKKISYGDYAKKRALRLMTPYVFINLLMLVPKTFVIKMTGGDSGLSLSSLAYSFINPHGAGICPHLWYLLALFIMSLCVPIVKQIKESNAKYVSLAVLFIISVIPYNVSSILCLNELRMYFVYYYIGYCWSGEIKNLSNRENPVKSIILFVSSAFFSCLVLGGYLRLSGMGRPLITLGGIVMLISFSILAESKLTLLQKLFTGKTFIIYILSLCVQNIVEVIGPKIGFNWPVTSLLMFGTGLLVPLVIHQFVSLVDKRISIPKFILAGFGM